LVSAFASEKDALEDFIENNSRDGKCFLVAYELALAALRFGSFPVCFHQYLFSFFQNRIYVLSRIEDFSTRTCESVGEGPVRRSKLSSNRFSDQLNIQNQGVACTHLI